MNKHDRDNYAFIMSLTPQEFDNWLLKISDDDVAYAMELIQQARADVDLQLAQVFDEVEDLSLAKNVLNRFTIKGVSK